MIPIINDILVEIEMHFRKIELSNFHIIEYIYKIVVIYSILFEDNCAFNYGFMIHLYIGTNLSVRDKNANFIISA